jgi:four helix bundle protein
MEVGNIPDPTSGFAHTHSAVRRLRVEIVTKQITGKWRLKLGESFKDLIVWQRAVQLTVEIYKLTGSFPASEQFGLTNQLRRASVSVASNIAEGYGRSTTGEYLQFLGHVRGSNCELQTQIVISKALGFGSVELLHQAESLSSEVSRMLVAIMNKLRE